MAVTLTAGTTGAVISGGGLTLSTATPFATVPAVTARGDVVKSSGIFAFEVDRFIPLFTRCDVGLTNSLTPSPSSLAGTVIIDKNGFVYVNGVFIRSASTPSLTTIVVDLDHGILWFSANVSGWNNVSIPNAPCDPAHYSEGIDISAILGSGLSPFAIVSMQSFVSDPLAASIATFNFGATPLDRALPTCVSTWEAAPAPPPPAADKARVNARMAPFRTIFAGRAIPAGLSMRAAILERADVAAGRIANTVGVTGAVTEANDVLAASASHAAPDALVDGDFTFVRQEPAILVPGEPRSSRFVIYSDTIMRAPPE